MTNTLLQAYANALDCSPAYCVGDNQQHDSFTQKIVADDLLYEALHTYYSLSEEKRGYVIGFIKCLQNSYMSESILMAKTRYWEIINA
jgi:hypothetical protein